MRKQQLYIGGEWIEGTSWKTLYSPYSGEALAEIAVAGEQHVEAAIASAEKAYAVTRRMPAHERSAILNKVVDLLHHRQEEAAALIAREAAKPIKAARAEVKRTIETYRFAAEEARRIQGESLPMDAAPGGEGRVAYTVREPIGVVGAITPFNFPMNLVAHKLGPAVAAGNTVVLKPAGQTPLSAYFIAELFEEAGLPKGALNVVSGSGKTIGDLLVSDERVKHITFTGSPGVGKGIRERAGLKGVTLELGSNSAVIVDKDIDNLDAVAERIAQGSFSYQGQVCISVQRIYVHESAASSFIELLREKTEALVIGDPLDSATDVSALISEEDTSRVLEWIEEAVHEGAELITGGEVSQRVLAPTIMTHVPHSAKLSSQEVFGPVVVIHEVSSIEEAIEKVNDSVYGLQAGIYTNHIQHALMAADLLEVGGVIINDIPTFRLDHMPYGGVKQSGYGREGIKYAIEAMTELKLVVMNRGM
ncbi:aldehyde dehydrogenase family protein [Paenibacillus shunpengii]|uniref:Aldehyde dehydrogenase family protein n=1 Tax=Paenibacillus shunpengii TaxID=2054424 RepID=A0ABW5SRN6_9BACL|nr:aldehyde dehydrogenase family protein [Paenibacillus sp. PDC88]SDX17925.1 Acyl-CoA reductase [Paenibacillus sp. PDC88]